MESFLGLFFLVVNKDNCVTMDNEKNTMIAVLQLLKKYNLKVSQKIFSHLIFSHPNLRFPMLLCEKYNGFLRD